MSRSRYPATRNEADSPRQSIERDLAEKEASIHDRIDALENEIVSTPAAIKHSVTKHPFLGIAGAVAAGVAVGLLVTRRSKPDVAPLHERLVEEYVDAVGKDIAHRVRRGRTVEESVRKAMEGRAPLIVYAPTRTVERESTGFLSQVADIAFKTALGFAVKVALDLASSAVDVEELRTMMAAEAARTGAGETGTPHAGDGATGTMDAADAH